MEYTIRELAVLAGVSTRTLRWYDHIGLLHPCRIGENGYRYYSTREADRLQHILFYRALGVELAQIRSLLDDPSFDRKTALRGHLQALEAEQMRIAALIRTVRRTLQAEERNETMMDAEKFEAFKRNAVEQNEAAYGKAVRAEYGDESADRANRRVLSLTQEEYDGWKSTGDAIRARLEAAVAGGESPDGAEGRAIALLHRKWLSFSWENYTVEAHAGLAELYVQDERFQRYYDANVPGCARFLRDAIRGAIAAKVLN